MPNGVAEQQKLKVLLVDDEPIAQLSLKALLGRHPSIEICGTAENGEDALEHIARECPDVLFLDIEMPGMSGFDLLEKVPFRLNVIFVTSSETEAIRAFEVNALDYLVKPVDPDRLGQSIKRLSEARGVHNERWEEVRESLSYYDWIYLPMARAQVFVMAAHILRIESCRNNTRVFMKDGRCFQIRRSLNHWEARLDSDCFCRINREMIINLKTVNQILNHDSGAVCLDIFGGTFPISRRRIKVLRERLVV